MGAVRRGAHSSPSWPAASSGVSSRAAHSSLGMITMQTAGQRAQELISQAIGARHRRWVTCHRRDGGGRGAGPRLLTAAGPAAYRERLDIEGSVCAAAERQRRARPRPLGSPT